MKKLVSMLTLICAVLFLSISAWAADGSITVIDIHDRNGNAISGMTVNLYQVAVEEDDNYRIQDGFQEIISNQEIADLNDANAEEVRNLAGNLRQIARQGNVEALETVQTDSNGQARFQTSLDNGIYLVDYVSLGNFSSEPSLIVIPMRMTEENGTVTLNYQLTLHGKVEDSTTTDVPKRSSGGGGGRSYTPVHSEGSNEGPTPSVEGAERPLTETDERVSGEVRDVKTGDESRMLIYAVISAMSAAGMGCLFNKKKRHSKAK